MDNYSLQDVKNIDESGRLNKEILERIIISIVRRIEIYNDYSEVEILKYLKSSRSVDIEVKEEIEGYIDKFEGHVIEKKEKINILLITLILIIILLLYMLLRR